MRVTIDISNALRERARADAFMMVKDEQKKIRQAADEYVQAHPGERAVIFKMRDQALLKTGKCWGLVEKQRLAELRQWAECEPEPVLPEPPPPRRKEFPWWAFIPIIGMFALPE